MDNGQQMSNNGQYTAYVKNIDTILRILVFPRKFVTAQPKILRKQILMNLFIKIRLN